MGAWDVGLFDDDTAVDVRLTFEAALDDGMTLAAATKQVLEEFEDALDDEDDGPIVLLALAALQWERGKPQARLLRRAIAILESGSGLSRWEDEGEPLLSQRRQAYEALKQQLSSPPPPPSRAPRRPRLKMNYREGDWFAVPLEEGGYAVGLVARLRPKAAPFGYFFGPRRPSVPTLDELTQLSPDDTILRCNFGDLGLLKTWWPVIGRHEPWNPALWPLPSFGRENVLHEGYAWLVDYSEETLQPVLKRSVSAAEIEGLPHDGLSGYGYVEGQLSDLLRHP
jgi:hypothetical protein